MKDRAVPLISQDTPKASYLCQCGQNAALHCHRFGILPSLPNVLRCEFGSGSPQRLERSPWPEEIGHHLQVSKTCFNIGAYIVLRVCLQDTGERSLQD